MHRNASNIAGHTRVVLSHYPFPVVLDDGLEEINENTSNYAAYLCHGFFDFDGMFHPMSYAVPKQPQPFRQPLASAGFLFAPGSILREVPLDPYLPFLFWGEEFLYSIRMWTHGYDIFCPNDNILFHYYTRNNSKKVWNDTMYEGLQQRSMQRVRYLLEMEDPLVPGRLWVLNSSTTHPAVTVAGNQYGVGNVRTLEEYWAFSRVDIKLYYVNHSWCKTLIPVMPGNPWW
jgi:hypothetical protein